MKSHLHLPVTPSLNGVDCSYAYSKFSSEFTTTATSFQKQPDKYDMAVIKQCPSIFSTLVSSMRHTVVNIFIWRTVAKIADSVVVSVSIHMANNHTARPWPQERFGGNYMNGFRNLRFVLRSFFETYRKIMRSRVWLANKTLSILDCCHATKAANFVSIMLYYRQPNLWGVRHG